MAVDLSDYADVLRREITPPGGTLFADVEDDVLGGFLGDAFWEARLDGLLKSWTLNEDTLSITPVDPSGADITRDKIALVVLYAGIRMLRNHILNLGSSFSAKAGPVEFETRNSAMVLTQMLQQLKDTKARILQKEGELFGNTDAYMVDGLSVRRASDSSYFGFLDDFYASLGT